MKKFLFLALFSLTYFTGFSQIGLTAGAQFQQAPAWEDFLQKTYGKSDLSIFSPAIYGGLDYWFRLKQKRIEFTPEVGFARYKGIVETSRQPDAIQTDTYTSSHFNFYFNTNIYPLDFGGDCNCPTFNKDGDLIKKGFFIRISPGVNYNIRSQEIEGLANVTSPLDSKDVVFSLRAGLGLDIGVSSFFTITPLIMGVYNTPSSWSLYDVSDVEVTPLAVEDQVFHLFAGIRLGFRFDELNKYGYR